MSRLLDKLSLLRTDLRDIHEQINGNTPRTRSMIDLRKEEEVLKRKITQCRHQMFNEGFKDETDQVPLEDDL